MNNMKVPDELLVELVKKVAGSDTVKLFDILNKRKNVSEFKIAEKMGISVNQVRNMIYRLQEHNLVSFTRKKDKVKGWYIYYWTFEKPKAVELIVDTKTKEIAEAEKEIENNEIRYYLCKFCRLKILEEEALETQFFCEACGEILEEQDINKRKRELTRRIKKDKESLEAASIALEQHRKLLARAMERQLAKEKAEKDKLRAEARAAKAKEKKATAKKTTKKAATKKTTKKAATKKTTPKKAATKKAATKTVSEKKPTKKKKGILGRVFKK